MAEREGFEPLLGLHLHMISDRSQSTDWSRWDPSSQRDGRWGSVIALLGPNETGGRTAPLVWTATSGQATQSCLAVCPSRMNRVPSVIEPW